jgi:hypothetical protein
MLEMYGSGMRPVRTGPTAARTLYELGLHAPVGSSEGNGRKLVEEDFGVLVDKGMIPPINRTWQRLSP